MPARRPQLPILYGALLVHTLASAGTYLFAKRALQEIPWAQLGLLRFAGASVCFALLLLVRYPRGERLPPKEARRKLWLLALVAVPINQGFFLGGLQLSLAAHAALLYTLTPLFVLLLAQLLIAERPTLRTMVGTALALGGAVSVLLARGLDLGRGPLVGDLLILIAVLAWAIYTAEGRELVHRFGALRTLAWTLIGGTFLYLPLGLAALLRGPSLQLVSPQAWLGVGYLVLVTSVLSYLIWYGALKHLTAARVAVFSNLQPLATALLAHWFLGEEITLRFLVSAVVVIGGVLLAQTRGAHEVAPARLPQPD